MPKETTKPPHLRPRSPEEACCTNSLQSIWPAKSRAIDNSLHSSRCCKAIGGRSRVPAGRSETVHRVVEMDPAPMHAGRGRPPEAPSMVHTERPPSGVEIPGALQGSYFSSHRCPPGEEGPGGRQLVPW